MPISTELILAAILLTQALPSLWADEAQGAASSGPAGLLMSLLPVFVFGFIFYFLLLRPQQKASKEKKNMIDNIKKGDRVLTTGGLYGHVVGLRGDILELKLADNLKVELNRNYVARVTNSAMPTKGALEGNQAMAGPAPSR